MMEAACGNGYAPVMGSPAMMMKYTAWLERHMRVTNLPTVVDSSTAES